MLHIIQIDGYIEFIFEGPDIDYDNIWKNLTFIGEFNAITMDYGDYTYRQMLKMQEISGLKENRSPQEWIDYFIYWAEHQDGIKKFDYKIYDF